VRRKKRVLPIPENSSLGSIQEGKINIRGRGNYSKGIPFSQKKEENHNQQRTKGGGKKIKRQGGGSLTKKGGREIWPKK